MTTRNERQGLTLDESHPNTPFITEFAVRGLWKALTDFECGEFEGASFIKFYWEASRFWPPRKSQAEFNSYARDRISDKVGYTRRRNDAFHIIERYFDKENLLTLNDVIEAVAFCSPTKPIPEGLVFKGTASVIVDLSKRRGDKFLKVDAEFFPILERLYPFERRDDRVIKTVPVGSSTREFDLAVLAFWFKYRNARRDEMQRALAFHSADRLDWTRSNLYSRWREGMFAERYAGRVDPMPEDAGRIETGEPFGGAILWTRKPTASALVVPMPEHEKKHEDAA
jgi:hypothetical protein